MTDIMLYEFLTNSLLGFVEQKIGSFDFLGTSQKVTYDQILKDGSTGLTSFKSLCLEIGVSEEKFSSQFLDPWKHLTQTQLEKVLEVWNWAHQFRFYKTLATKPIKELNALHWTVIQIEKLKLPGLKVFSHQAADFLVDEPPQNLDIISARFLSADHSMPFKQCFVCGRLDQDTRGRLFREKRLTACHLSDCKVASSNLMEHEEDCCSRRWNLKKDALKRSLKNKKGNKELVIQHFSKFCDELYMFNLGMDKAPRPKLPKPLGYDFSWSGIIKAKD